MIYYTLFFKAMLLFLNTISEKTVKYFHLLEIAGKNFTYPGNFNLEIDIIAKNIANKYNLKIFLPKYIKTLMSMGNQVKQKQKNWQIITVDKPTEDKPTEDKPTDVVILKNQDNDKYNLVNNELIPYNDSIHSFFKAILLFLNNYLDNNITYFAFLEIVGKPNMFVGNENINEKIVRYAQIIANKYQVKIEFFPIKSIGGTIGFLVDKDGYILSTTILPTLPTDY